jgi:hypothetical protein
MPINKNYVALGLALTLAAVALYIAKNDIHLLGQKTFEPKGVEPKSTSMATDRDGRVISDQWLDSREEATIAFAKCKSGHMNIETNTNILSGASVKEYRVVCAEPAPYVDPPASSSAH